MSRKTENESFHTGANAFLQFATAQWVSYSNLRSRDSLQLRETPTPAPSGEVPFVWSIRRRRRLRGVWPPHGHLRTRWRRLWTVRPAVWPQLSGH